MIDLANLFRIVPVEFVLEVSKTGITLKNGFTADLFFSENDVKVSDTPDTKDAGQFFTQSAKIPVEKISDDLRTKYARNRKVIVILYTEKGDTIYWGTLDYPVTATITPNQQADMFSFTCKSLTPIF